MQSSVSKLQSVVANVDDPNKAEAILAYISRVEAAQRGAKAVTVNYDNITNDEFESLLNDVTPRTHDEMNDLSLLNIQEIGNIKFYLKKNKQGKYRLPQLLNKYDQPAMKQSSLTMSRYDKFNVLLIGCWIIITSLITPDDDENENEKGNNKGKKKEETKSNAADVSVTTNKNGTTTATTPEKEKEKDKATPAKKAVTADLKIEDVAAA